MYVCICHGIKEKDIQKAVADGAESMRDLRKSLNVGSQCGKCISYASQVVQETREALNYNLAIAV